MSHVLDNLDFYTQCIEKGQWFMIWKQNWAVLFEHCPEWIKYFSRELWEKEHWQAAVKVLPALGAACPFELKKTEKVFAWESASKNEKVKYVLTHPEFYERLCREEELAVFDRIQIFDENPELAENFDWSSLQSWSMQHPDRREVGFYWSFLLRSNPQFAPYCPCLHDLYPDAQSRILRYKPELSDQIAIKWQDFCSEDWAQLLITCPQFADKCIWRKLAPNDLQDVLQAQPQLLEFADTDYFSSAVWLDVLLKNPGYITKCPEDMLPELNWSPLLKEHPELYKYFPASKYSRWSDIAAVAPSYLDDCPWQDLSGNELKEILLRYPEYISKVPLAQLTGHHWSELLIENPAFAKFCRWGKLKGGDWVDLILRTRGFKQLCPWKKLTGTDWQVLIDNAPHYIKRCPKNKLKKWDWVRLMIRQPQLGEYCPFWNTFNEDHWRGILKYNGEHAWRCPPKLRPALAEDWFWKAADQWHLEHDE